ncbi:hemiasterlin resistant protein 1-like [Corticium candelabrum]|uniref:hemiasterlin resistant protein 1-like n=1 Tax=Corticium candelabrum TaxID=121492 RepID=UPI002E2599DF|nr:hemiasterlin resistant protein 1-like [Corticium candelabrum]
MPRRGGGGRRSASGTRQRQYRLPAERPSSSVAQSHPQQPGQQSSRPGLLGQFASTAAGVAVGHAVGEAIVGSFSNHSDTSAQTSAPQSFSQANGDQHQQMPCQLELQRFMKCAENQSDLTFCEQFHQSFKDCKMLYNIQ